VIHNNENESINKFSLKRDEQALKVKLKNAVMQEWALVMNKRKSKSIKDLVEEMTQKKNEKAKKSKEKDADNENGDGQVK
jgi:hypothetical protein